MEQQSLCIPAKPVEEIADSVLFAQKDIISVVRLMISSRGYDFDQVGCSLGYSSSHWSEILHGKKNLPLNKLDEAMNFCESDLPLIWWNHHRGYEAPRPRQTKVEKELEEAKKVIAVTQILLRGLMIHE